MYADDEEVDGDREYDGTATDVGAKCKVLVSGDECSA